VFERYSYTTEKSSATNLIRATKENTLSCPQSHCSRLLVQAHYATLRLTAAMYHRFRAPHNLRVDQVRHIYGDTFNVNPAALAHIERLFCRNERVIIRTILEKTGHVVTLVPVAAILVAGIRLRFLDLVGDPRYSTTIPCNSYFAKGQEMGWFEHGSTILVLAPKGIVLCEGVRPTSTIRIGEDLMRIKVE
jgi:phosphatidylserine decarboxylase